MGSSKEVVDAAFVEAVAFDAAYEIFDGVAAAAEPQPSDA